MFTFTMQSELYVAVHHLMEWRTDIAVAGDMFKYGPKGSGEVAQRGMAAKTAAIQVLQPWCSSRTPTLRATEALADQAAASRLKLALQVARCVQAECDGHWPDEKAVAQLMEPERLALAMRLSTK